MLSALTIRHITTEFSMNQFYPKSNVLVQNEQKISEIFSTSKDTSLFVLFETLDQSSWLSEKNFQSIKNITQRFEQTDHFNKVTSLSTLQKASSSSEQIEVGQLLDGVTLEQRKKLVNNHPLVKPQNSNSGEMRYKIQKQK